MAKVSDVVSLKTGYANFVELKSSFEESQENADRMAMYRPTKAHRVAFERICKGLVQPNDKKFYLLSGSYGTGKSHLCLMTANVFSKASSDPEISGFYENYQRLDEDKAKTLKSIRKNGQYLVAICDYHSGRKFEDVVLKAIFEACESKGLNSGIQTEFDEAERQITEWKNQEQGTAIRDFYQDFIKALELEAPGMTVKQLREGLKDFDSTFLNTFRSVFKKMMGGHGFSAKSGNLIPIVRNLVQNKAFKERFKGLAIFYDEFGFTLEKSAYSKDVLQGFMESVCQHLPNVIFVGCIHKDFKSYADRFSKDDIAVMSARMTQVDLLNEGIEEIIGAIVETHKDSEEWKKTVEPKSQVLDSLLPRVSTLKLFPWISDPSHLRQRVLEDIYGVHPMALSTLLTLSSEIGSDARSTFTFFSGDIDEAKGSYAEFIKNAEIIRDGGMLNLYTVDQLYHFFRKELSPDNSELRERQRAAVNGYVNSFEAYKKSVEDEPVDIEDDFAVNVLRTILIYDLCQIPANDENVEFGLYCLKRSDKNKVGEALGKLRESGALFYRRQSDTWELAESAGEDPHDLINNYLENDSLHPSDLVRSFVEEARPNKASEFVKANQYNLAYGEDKRCYREFVRAKDLGTGLWKSIKEKCEETKGKPKKSFDGALVYALCESEAEIQVAKDALLSLTDDNIAVNIPHSPKPFTDDLLNVKACLFYLHHDQATKLSAQTESRLRDYLDNKSDGYKTLLMRLFDGIESGEDSCWYWRSGEVLINNPTSPQQVASRVGEELFTEQCKIKHPDLNYSHDDKWITGTNAALKQAVEVLLNAEHVLIDNGNPDSHGQKRYLEKVLFKGAGALKKLRSDGIITYFECQTDPAKLADNFPTLKLLHQEITSLKGDQAFNIGQFINRTASAPYGVGGNALMLMFAHLVRGYGERLIAYKDSTRMTEIPLSSYSEIAEVLSDFSSSIVLVVRSISVVQQQFIDELADKLGAPALLHGERRTLTSTFEALKKWWNTLNPIAKVVKIYPEESRARLLGLSTLMNGITAFTDKFNFLLEQLANLYLPGALGRELSNKDVATILDGLAEDYDLLESGESSIQRNIAGSLCELFDGEGDLTTCEELTKDWYKNLSPRQRNEEIHDNDNTKAIVRNLGATDPFSTIVFNSIPSDLNLGKLSEWTSDKSKDLLAKIQISKEEIEKAKTEVNKPDLMDGVHELSKGQGLVVRIPEGASELIYTTSDEDPRKSDDYIRVKSDVDLANLIADKPSVQLKIRAVDIDGNYSKTVSIELVNKERKYEVQEQEDLFGHGEGTFKIPSDKSGFIAVVKSVLNFGEKKNLIQRELADKLKKLLDESE